jgi:cytochrome c
MRARVLVLILLFGAIGAEWGAEMGAKAADIAAGEKIFAKCRQCHQIGPGAKNFYGPLLNGLIDRPAGVMPGYRYSEANKHSRKIWDRPTLASYLREPQHDMPKTYMTFAGLQDEADIENVIAFIAQFDADGKIRP